MIKNLTVLLSAAIMLSGCSEDSLTNLPDSENNMAINPLEYSPTLDKIQDNLSDRLAYFLSNSIKEAGLRKFLKEKALLKIDNDYDILVANIVNEEIIIGNRAILFRNLLTSPQSNTRTTNLTEQFFDSLALYYPLLQIAIPELKLDSAESWDTDNHIPQVAILDSEYDDQISTSVKGYDSDGNTIEIDAVNEPESVVLVIGTNERVIPVAQGSQSNEVQSCSTLLFENEHYKFYTAINCLYYDEPLAAKEAREKFEEIGSSGRKLTQSLPNGRVKANCADRRGRREFLYQIRCNGTCREGGWLSGGPELSFRINGPTGEILFDPAAIFEPKKKRHIENRWWPQHVGPLFTWNTGLDEVYWTWWENDPGPSGSVTLTATSGFTFTVPIGANDDALGSRRVLITECQHSGVWPLGHIWQSWQTNLHHISWRDKIWY